MVSTVLGAVSGLGPESWRRPARTRCMRNLCSRRCCVTVSCPLPLDTRALSSTLVSRPCCICNESGAIILLVHQGMPVPTLTSTLPRCSLLRPSCWFGRLSSMPLCRPSLSTHFSGVPVCECMCQPTATNVQKKT